ncbi:MAG: hypothetical protein FD146_2 [Anaerolineaceae bacterium]|nr:MAG: hypothetical protein FD146_2 [Anaerolineaceae bacterium]
MRSLGSRHRRPPRKLIALIVPFIGSFLFLFLLGSCGGNGPINGVATWTPRPSATATCPSNIQLSTPDGYRTTSRMIVILYDPWSIGDQSLEMENGDKITDIPLFVSRIIPDLMGSSDLVSVFQLGYDSFNDARVLRLNSYITPPELYAVPSPFATLTPLPPTTTPEIGYGGVATKKAIQVHNTAKPATETANNAIYNCQKDLWNNIIAATATAWEQIDSNEVNRIGTAVAGDIKNAEVSRGRTDELYNGGLYWGLSFATQDLETYCGNYADCILIIIDDLHTWGKHNPDNLYINLNYVSKVYVIMPDCRDINQPDCAQLQTYWDSEFPGLGVNLDERVYLNGERVEINLIQAIGR